MKGKGTKYMAKGGKTTKYMAKGGPSGSKGTKYMAKGGPMGSMFPSMQKAMKGTKYMAKGGAAYQSELKDNARMSNVGESIRNKLK